MIGILVIQALFFAITGPGSKATSETLEILGKVSQGEVNPKTYMMGPGDVLEISLQGPLNFSYEAEIDLEGNVGLEQEPVSQAMGKPMSTTAFPPIISTIKVSGLSLYDAEKKIKETYSKFYPNAPCQIRLVRARTFYIPVLGAVVRPGLVMVSALERITQVLISADGIQPGAALSKVQILSLDGKVKEVNLYKFLTEGSTKDNPLVAQGNRIVVPFTDSFVRVKGAIVQNPLNPTEGIKKVTQLSGIVPKAYDVNETVVEYEEGDSVGNVIMKAGGIQERADLSAIKIERDGRWIPSNFSTLVKSGDVIYLPFLDDEVYVEGAVTNPGAYPFVPGKTVGDYVAIAGGPLERGKKKVYMMKMDGKRRKVSDDMTVSRGERLFVPWTAVKWWKDYFQIASVITTLVVTWLTIRR